MEQHDSTKQLEILREMAKSLPRLMDHYERENIQLVPFPQGKTYMWNYDQLRTNIKETKNMKSNCVI